MRIRHFRTLLVCAILTSAALLGDAAMAAGISAARFGGVHGNPVADNVTTIYYNPAGLAFGAGHRVFIDANFVFRTAEYTRPEEAIDNPAPTPDEVAALTGTNQLSNFLIVPFAGFATDFGLDIPLSAGVAFFVPFGGSSSWDEVDAVPNHPGSIDGSQRWYNIDGVLRTFAVSLGVAYQIEPIRLSIGLSGNAYFSEVDTLRARNGDGRDTLRQPSGDLAEGRSRLEGTSTDIGIGGGLLWEAVEDVLWVGASYQSQPGFGEIELEGTLYNLLGTAPLSTTNIAITQGLPDVIRFGVRVRPVPDLELRLHGDFTRWSTFEQHCIVNTDVATNIEEVCSVAETGEQIGSETDGIVQDLIRRWEDSFGVRFSGSYYLGDSLELFAEVGYDSNAIPDESLEPALQDFEKMTATLGGRYQFTDWFAASLSANNAFYFERDTRGVATADRFNPPSRQPSSMGIYTQNIFWVNLNVELTFGGGRDDEGEMVMPGDEGAGEEGAEGMEEEEAGE